MKTVHPRLAQARAFVLPRLSDAGRRHRALIELVNNRIDFVCVRPEHQTALPREALTMHEELWAYCPSGAKPPHEWKATGGVTLAEAMQVRA